MADALMAWCRLADSIGARHLLRTQGNIVVWRGASAAMRRRKAWLTQSRGSATVRDLSQLEKFALDRLFLSRVATALKVENTGQISNLSGMIEALHAAFQQAGGLIRKDHVRALSAEHSSVTVLFTAGGSVTPERVVVAAGVQSGALLKTLGLRVPLIAERGYHLHYHRHDWPADAPAVLVEDRSVVLTPMDTGLRATSFVEFGRPDSPPDPRKWRRLERHLAELGVSVEGKPERWHGARPTLPDYLPAIGSSTRYRNLAYAFGHQHIGLTLAAATAELLTRELSSGHPEAVLAPFSLRRYLGDRI
jgi:D-amino-acid dehydrogenase